MDLITELTLEYENQFGKRPIRYEQLDKFLLTSVLTKELDSIAHPLGKKIKGYSVEKFHLLDKKYYGEYLPGIDLMPYPEFTIMGMGLSVRMENRPQQ